MVKHKRVHQKRIVVICGSLSFAPKGLLTNDDFVKPGRMFMHRLINTSTTVEDLHQIIVLDSEAKADINWWVSLFPSWEGKEFIQEAPVTSHAL